MDKISKKLIESWEEFDLIVRNHRVREWIYRGQIDANWSLISSLHRTFDDVLTLTRLADGKPKRLERNKQERISLQNFMATAHQYNIVLPPVKDPLEWLAIMQHYGAPTRLLDATFSPYVAAYFALEYGTDDSAIYCIRHSVLTQIHEQIYKDNKAVYRQILDKDDDEVIYAYEPQYTTPRLLAQQGLFLVSGSLKKSHGEIIGSYDLKKNDAIKIIIPKELRAVGVEHIRRMNVVSTMLFPGIDGFCRSFRHQPLFKVGMLERVGISEQMD
jgi:hypothetical protein